MPISQFTDRVYDAIKAHVVANWNAPDVIIYWPNEAVDTRTDDAFVSFEIRPTVLGQESIGEDQQRDNRWDEEGMIWFHVCVPRGSGVTGAMGAARRFIDIFRGTRLIHDDIEFMDAVIEDGTAEGNFFRVSTGIEYRFWNAYQP